MYTTKPHAYAKEVDKLKMHFSKQTVGKALNILEGTVSVGKLMDMVIPAGKTILDTQR